MSTNADGLSADCANAADATSTPRCYRGSNNGGTCATGTDCPGGTCAQYIGSLPLAFAFTTGVAQLSESTGHFCPGQSTPGCFLTKVCRSGASSGAPCTTNADCAGGALCGTTMCAGGANDGKGCAVAGDCPGGTCSVAGTQCRLVRLQGTPASIVPIGTPNPLTLVSTYCVQSSTNPTINAAANLPGPGAVSVQGAVVLLP